MFSGTCALLGTNSFSSNSFTVYPNPARDLISIEGSNGANITSYKVADLNGRVVKSKESINATAAQINISDLQSGVYMMTINSDNGSAVKKIIKE